jgi:rod shape determining protein RodA
MSLPIERSTQTTIFGISAASAAVLLGVAGLLAFSLSTIRAIDLADFPTGLVPQNVLRTHVIYLGTALAAMFIIRALNYQRIGDWAYLIFIVMLILLAAVLVLGIAGQYIPALGRTIPKINGSYRWIRILGFQFQPSEFIKIAYILGLARYLRYRNNYRRLEGLIGPFAFTMLPMVLIILEPDLGTVLLLLPVLLIMLYAAGAKIKHLAAIIVLIAISGPILFALMKDYQKSRVAGVLLQTQTNRDWIANHPKIKDILFRDKNLDRWNQSPEGYHLFNSKAAIGSAGLFGFGYGKGPYLEGNKRIPECHNDFIFAMICHQFGFVGAIAIVLLYLVVAVGLTDIAGDVSEPFGRLVAVGVLAMLLTQAGTNIGMTLGLMPITGVTLPFISYGGSSLLTYFTLIGFALSVDRARPIHIGPRPFEFSNDEDR